MSDANLHTTLDRARQRAGTPDPRRALRSPGRALRSRHRRDAQEVFDGAEVVTGLLLGLGLAIHGRGDAFGEIGTHLVVRWQEIARRDESLLRLGELQQVEVRLPDDRVRDAPFRLVSRRLVREHQVRDFDRALQQLRLEDHCCLEIRHASC